MKGKKADVWSFGVLYFRILFGYFPFDSLEQIKKELFYNILKKQVSFPKDASWEDSELIRRLLEKNEESRICFGKVLQCFLKGV